jgi:hypothetical protein
VTGAGIALTSDDQLITVMLRPGSVHVVSNEMRNSKSIIHALRTGLITIEMDWKPSADFVAMSQLDHVAHKVHEVEQEISGFSGMGYSGTSGFSGLGGLGSSGYSGYSGAAGSGSGGSALEIQSQGVAVGFSAAILNFVGAGVAALQSFANPAQVNIYIPPLTYASHFNTTDGTTNATVAATPTASRYVSAPASEGVPFKIGNWAAGAAHPTLNGIAASTLTYSTAGLFSIYTTTTTTITVTVLDADGVSVLATNAQTITGNLDNTTQNIEIHVTGFVADSIKYKGNLTVTIGIGTILPSGGRFSVQITHADSTDGTFTFAQNDVFWDRNTTAATIGGVTMAQSVPVIKSLSGVQFYTTGSTFNVGVTGINELNDESYPLTQAIVTAAVYSLPELDLHGAQLTGWTDAYNNTGDTYSKTDWTLTAPNYYALTTTATATATPQDWIAGAPVNSPNADIAIDTFTADQTAIYEDFNNEALRLKSDLSTPWDSTQSLASYDSGNGLEVLDSRLVYPTINFTPYSPNAASQPNYAGLSGSRLYYRAFLQAGVSHSNGIFQFGDYNVTETNITNQDVLFELSLDGINWFNMNLPYLGGALNNGQGCRINADAVALNINNEIQFTFGTGLFTSAGTGSGWGVWLRITYAGDGAGMGAHIGILQIIDWV